MSTDTITSNVSAVTLASGGVYGDPVTIASTAVVSGNVAVTIDTPWTVENYGFIGGTAIGVKTTAASGGYTEAWITNHGTIAETGTGRGAGIDATGTVTVSNYGLISSTYDAVILAGGALTNQAGGEIDGGNFGILDAAAAATIVNAGTIDGSVNDAIRFVNYSGSGVSLIDNTGVILSQGNNGVYITQSHAVVENAGTIGSSYFNGVKIKGALSATVSNSGTIQGGTDGVYLTGVDATLENSGTIGGTQAAAYLDGSGSNRLIIDPGAVFDGTVIAAGAAANTIELAAGASAGTLAGLGSHYQGFQTITIDSGATWDIAGTVAAFDSTAIDGFNSHDRLDLTDLAFDAGDTVTLDNGTDLLTIKDSGGGVLATIQLAGDFTGDFFQLSDDGTGHMLMTEEATPCFLRGTMIRTAAGDRRVEDLEIGDLVMTAGGEALPLKWIGRRGYRDWLAVGNEGVQPICFRAGSIARRVPARDLYVSPEHAMFVDGMLIPACHLVNGISVVKVGGMEEIEYFHLEFERHVVILAEGAPTESFVDDDSRMLFHNAGEYRRLYPDAPLRGPVEFCAPRVEAGHALEAVRRTLAARAVPPLSNREAAAQAHAVITHSPVETELLGARVPFGKVHVVP